MKIISKVILAFALLLVATTIEAQNMPVRIGLKGGLSISDIGGDVDDTDVRFGGIIGATADFRLNSNWYILGALELTTKGAEVDYDWYGGARNVKINAVYLQTPVHIGYKFRVGKGISVMPHAGTYFALGMGGKTKWGGNKNDTFTDVLERFDFGLGTGGSVEFSNNIVLDLKYDFSLLDVGSHAELRNSVLYLTAGYKF